MISSQSNDGIEYCSEVVTIASGLNAKGEVEQIELRDRFQSLGIFKNDINFKLGHNGFYGYNRFGGTVDSREATRIVTTISIKAAFAFLPYHSTHGQRLRLSYDNKTLTYQGHNTTYGIGYSFTCIYQRD